MSFFTSLNFSSANEDSLSELAAFNGHPMKQLLCLTGSGARVLDMLLTEAEQVIALDLNPMQNHLLRLKMAAFEVLSYEDLLSYLGVMPCKNRSELHQRVNASLPKEAQVFWQQNYKLIAKGIWYAGLWEKVLRFGARGNRLIRHRALEALFNAPSVQEQSEIWKTRFDDWIWHFSLRLLGQRWIWTKVIGEPGGAFLPPPKQLEARLANAFRRASGTFLFRESDFASLILRGRHQGPHAVPLHLQPQNLEQIRARLSRIKIVTGGLGNLSEIGLQQIDGFSLSDFGSYCTQADYDHCWAGVLAAAAPNAHFCERVFMNPLSHNSPRIALNKTLSEKLTVADKAIIYDIRAGRIEVAK